MSRNDFKRMKEQIKPSQQTLNKLYQKIEQEKQHNLKPKSKTNKIIKYGSVAACFIAVIISASVIITNISSQTAINYKPPQNTTDNTSKQPIEINNNQIEIIKDNNYDSINLNADIELNGKKYTTVSVMSVWNEEKTVSDNTLLYSESMQKADIKAKSCEVSSIKGVSSDTAVIVKVKKVNNTEEIEGTYTAINKEYNPKTLENIVQDFGLNEDICFDNADFSVTDSKIASKSQFQISKSDKELYNMIFSNLSEEGIDSVPYTNNIQTVDYIDISLYANAVSINIQISKDGYLLVSIGNFNIKYFSFNNFEKVWGYIQKQYCKNTEISETSTDNPESSKAYNPDTSEIKEISDGNETSTDTSKDYLTDEDLRQMEEVDNRLQKLMKSDKYKSYSEEQQKEAIENLLNEMAEENLVEKGSVYYDDYCKNISFEYNNLGIRSLIILREFDEYMN